MTDRKTCTRCGTEFDPSEWYPTATRQEGGSLDIYAFCSSACRQAWQRTSVEHGGSSSDEERGQ